MSKIEIIHLVPQATIDVVLIETMKEGKTDSEQ